LPKKDSGGSVESVRGILRIVLILVVVFALAGVFGGKLTPANDISIPGIIVMILGIAAVFAAEPIARKLRGEGSERLSVVIKLAGVAVCAVGAIITICQ